MQIPDPSNVNKPQDKETLSAEAEAHKAIRSLAVEVREPRADQETRRRENEDHFQFPVASMASGPRLQASANSSPRRSSPVFVLGNVRSGTTAIGNALQTAGYPGWTEGHIFPLLHDLQKKIDWWMDHEAPFMGGGWGIDFLDPHALQSVLVGYFEELYLSHHLSTNWVDKTPGPEMIEAAPFLQSLWPQAKFIFCHRRGIENVKSQLRRFNEEPGVNLGFEEACKIWARSMELWADVRNSLEKAYIELDQAEMANNPADVARKIAGLLGLSSGAASAVLRAITESMPERTASTFAPESLDETGWTDEQKAFFVSACGATMQKFGYTLGDDADAKLRAAIMLPFTDEAEKVCLINVASGEGYTMAEHGTFMLHPRVDGQPPTVTYLSLPFKGHSCFFSILEIRHPQSEPVCYRLRIHGSEGGGALVDAHCIVEPGDVRSWSVDFPPLEGAMNVSISTEMVPEAESHFYAWAHWIGPRFLVK